MHFGDLRRTDTNHKITFNMHTENSSLIKISDDLIGCSCTACSVAFLFSKCSSVLSSNGRKPYVKLVCGQLQGERGAEAKRKSCPFA
jgi:hypothetical protein